ncbi:MAG: DUF192 domain-containing protein [Rectinema sp.]
MRKSATGRAGTLKSLVSLALFVLLISCAGNADAADKPNPTLKTVELRIGAAVVKAEVAATELERNRGLMFRKSLADGKGMLFVFDKDERISFWMKNTSLPLSLAYLSSDGVITQILDLKPFSQEARQSERSVRYALEVPQGWFAKQGIAVGDKVEIPALK